MSKFKIGDKVRMSAEGKRCYSDTFRNPHDVIGTVSGESEFIRLCIRVEWPKGFDNVYTDGDLELANQIEVGGKYTSFNGGKWECIFTRDGKAWLVGVFGDRSEGTAYVFNSDGKSICLGSDWNIKFEPVRETVSEEVELSGETVSVTFDLIDGKPDWSTAKVTPCD